MRFALVSSVAFLCLPSSVYCVDLHRASSAARISVSSKSAHPHSHSHSYSYSHSYFTSHSYSHSHSHSASHHQTHAANAPVVVHGQIEKRNIIDFFKRLINPKSNDSAIASASASDIISASKPAAALASVSSSMSNSAMPPAASSVSVPQFSLATKKTFKKIIAVPQGDSHASVGFADLVTPLHSAAVPGASHASGSSRHARGKYNASLSSLSSKTSSKALVSASASASVSPHHFFKKMTGEKSARI